MSLQGCKKDDRMKNRPNTFGKMTRIGRLGRWGVCTLIAIGCLASDSVWAQDSSSKEPQNSPPTDLNKENPSKSLKRDSANTAKPSKKVAGSKLPAQLPADPRATQLPILAQRLSALLAKLTESEKSKTSGKQSKQMIDRLDALAKRSQELAGTLKDSNAKLQARQIQLEAYNALASQARLSRDKREASYRVLQLRSAARSTRGIASPSARTLGEFWLLHADLFEINQANADKAVRSGRASERMERFLKDQGWFGNNKAQEPTGGALAAGPEEAAAIRGREAASEDKDEDIRLPIESIQKNINRQVVLALLRLHEAQGMTATSRRLIERLKSSPKADQEIRSTLEQQYPHADALGRSFHATLRLADGSSWSSAEHQGEPVLIMFSADWYPSSLAGNRKLLAGKDARRISPALAVLSVKLPQLTSTSSQVVRGESVAGQSGGKSGAKKKLPAFGGKSLADPAADSAADPPAKPASKRLVRVPDKGVDDFKKDL
jgi:hypothetical protein